MSRKDNKDQDSGRQKLMLHVAFNFYEFVDVRETARGFHKCAKCEERSYIFI